MAAYAYNDSGDRYQQTASRPNVNNGQVVTTSYLLDYNAGLTRVLAETDAASKLLG